MGFFDAESFEADADLRGRRPKIVTSIAMFYDLENPNQFVSDIKRVMDPEGLWIVQMSYLPMMLKTNEFGNICHEHLEYYSLKSFEYLLNLHGFEIVDVELNDINGGSLRAYIRNRNADPNRFADATYRELAAERVQSLREQEVRLGLDDIEVYREFASRWTASGSDVVRFIGEQVAGGEASVRVRCLDQGQHAAAVLRPGPPADPRGGGAQPGQVGEGDRRHPHPDRVGGRRACGKARLLPRPPVALRRRVPAAGEARYLLSGGKFIVPMPHFTLI